MGRRYQRNHIFRGDVSARVCTLPPGAVLCGRPLTRQDCDDPQRLKSKLLAEHTRSSSKRNTCGNDVAAIRRRTLGSHPQSYNPRTLTSGVGFGFRTTPNTTSNGVFSLHRSPNQG